MTPPPAPAFNRRCRASPSRPAIIHANFNRHPVLQPEEEAAPALLAELRPVVDGIGDAEVLLIDDGIRDGTGRVLNEAAAAWPTVRV